MDKIYGYVIVGSKSQIGNNNIENKISEIMSKYSTFGCCRFVYNTFLDKRIEIYENSKETYSYK